MQRSACPAWNPSVLVLPLESRDPCPAQCLWNTVKYRVRHESCSLLPRREMLVIGSLWPQSSFSACLPPPSGLLMIHLLRPSPPLPLSSSLFPSLPLLPSLVISFHLFSFLLLRDTALLHRPGCPQGPSGPSLKCRQNCRLFRGVQSVVGVTCTWHNATVLSVSR